MPKRKASAERDGRTRKTGMTRLRPGGTSGDGDGAVCPRDGFTCE
jgi:hypothetical protein